MYKANKGVVVVVVVKGVLVPLYCLPSTSKKTTAFLLNQYTVSILVITWQAEQIEFDSFLLKRNNRPGCTRVISLLFKCLRLGNNLNRFNVWTGTSLKWRCHLI